MEGANIAQQGLKSGLLDELQIDLVPVLLGDGVRLFEHLGIKPIESPGVIHLMLRVIK